MAHLPRPAAYRPMTRLPLIALSGILACALPFAADARPPAVPPTAAVENRADTPPSRPTLESALASPVPIWSRNGLLVEKGGRALYTFTKDVPGQSRCDSACEALWPPHFAEPGAKPNGPFTLARSFDGRPMWAWQGKPLYRWVSDRKRGAAGGDGVADVWFLVKVPPQLQSQVTAYFPMPMPRPGARPPVPPAKPATSAEPTSRNPR